MKNLLVIVGMITVFLVIIFYFIGANQDSEEVYILNEDKLVKKDIGKNNVAKLGEIEIVAENLSVPWEIEFLNSSEILVTERNGKLSKIGVNSFTRNISGVEIIGEGGLLGMALHPNFNSNHWIYLYFTTKHGGVLRNVVKRYVLNGSEIIDDKIIVDNIPAGRNHNGGRIAFGPDGFLYVTTGDSGNSELSQNVDSLAGKILRVDENGEIPKGNPFGNEVYSFGHRNPQGLAWDDQGRLWATEHGRSGVLSGFDELNLIEKGENYGWPIFQGDETRDGFVGPVVHSGSNATWAPGGIAYFSGKLFFSGLRGGSLYEVKLDEDGKVINVNSYFKDQFGRIRNVKIGPRGDLYIMTSNQDGRGSVHAGDDKIIKIPYRLLNN